MTNQRIARKLRNLLALFTATIPPTPGPPDMPPLSCSHPKHFREFARFQSRIPWGNYCTYHRERDFCASGRAHPLHRSPEDLKTMALQHVPERNRVWAVSFAKMVGVYLFGCFENKKMLESGF